jgi:hypothetical protein
MRGTAGLLLALIHLRRPQSHQQPCLPVKVQVEREGLRFYLTHATPSDHHYGRIAADSDDWVAELERLDADVLLVGHSHVPFIRRIGGKVASIRAAWDSRDPATPARVMRFGMTANLFFARRTTQLKRQSEAKVAWLQGDSRTGTRRHLTNRGFLNRLSRTPE